MNIGQNIQYYDYGRILAALVTDVYINSNDEETGDICLIYWDNDYETWKSAKNVPRYNPEKHPYYDNNFNTCWIEIQ